MAATLPPPGAAAVAGEESPATDAPGEPREAPARGPILDETDGPAVHALIKKRWEAWDAAFKRYEPRWQLHEMWRDNVRYCKLVDDPDTDDCYVWRPDGPPIRPPVPNKANDLCEKVVATLMVDPPLPECEPASDGDEDRADAEFATRVLTVEGAESGLNIKAKFEEALDTSSHLDSAFLYACVEPQGGGFVPQEAKAHPAATDAANPLVDPQTGLVGPDFVTKYVMPDGTLSASPVGAVQRWVPSVVLRVLTPRHVRFWHRTATGLDDAGGVILLEATTVGALKSRFPDVAALGEDALAKVAAWRPKGWKKVLPPHLAVPTKTATNEDGTVSDDAIAFTWSVYIEARPEYPRGAYVVVGGEGAFLYQDDWTRTVQEGSSASEAQGEREEPLFVPVAQVRQFRDTIRRSPYGRCLIEKLGPPEEMRASLLGAALEFVFRYGNPLTFLPIGSIVQPGQLKERGDDPILFNPQGKPEVEQIPAFPQALLELEQTLGAGMDSTSGLEEAAQGVSDPSVQSGVHAQTIVEQALVAIGPIKRASDDAFVRIWRVVLQLYRVFYDQPRRIKYLGDDNAWKEREWSKSDLGSTKDVRIARGTSTMLPASAKQSLALSQVQAGVLAPEDAARAIQGNVSALIGAQDNPHRNRIKRRIAQWREGPPAAAVAQTTAQLQQQLAAQPPQPQPVQQPDGSVVMGPPPPPPDPTYLLGQQLFKRLPCDDEPAVALIHLAELSRGMADVDFARYPGGWQQAYTECYLATRQAAGVQTVTEQQQAAMQQQHAAQQAEMAKQSSAQAHEASENQADRDAKTAEAQQRQQTEMAAAQVQGNAGVSA